MLRLTIVTTALSHVPRDVKFGDIVNAETLKEKHNVFFKPELFTSIFDANQEGHTLLKVPAKSASKLAFHHTRTHLASHTSHRITRIASRASRCISCLASSQVPRIACFVPHASHDTACTG